jgi:hypothetical protein
LIDLETAVAALVGPSSFRRCALLPLAGRQSMNDEEELPRSSSALTGLSRRPRLGRRICAGRIAPQVLAAA